MRNDIAHHQALTLEHECRYAEAAELFEYCFGDPMFDEGELRFRCGWCLENEKQPQRALALYEQAAFLSNIPSVKLHAYFRAGWVLMQEKDFVNAADRFCNAVEYGDLVGLKNETYMHASFWLASCLESQSCYLDALKWYRFAQSQSQSLDPESRLRQVVCLNHIGLYDEALNVCRTFDASAPEEFDEERYAALKAEVRREREMLEDCSGPQPKRRKVFHVVV